MSSAIIIALITFVAVGLATYVAYSVVFPRKTVVQERLEALARGRGGMETDLRLDRSREEETPLQKSVGLIGSAIPLSAQTLSKTKITLIQAGYRKASAPMVFFGAKAALGGSLFMLLFTYTLSVKHDMRTALILAILGLVAGMILPNVWLNERLKKRKTDIFHSLPDVLDLMTVCVEAGLGLDASIVKITEEKQFAKQTLSKEFAIVSQEIRAGKMRIEALRDLGQRTGVEDIRALVALLIQTERLGASLARSLRVHSDSLRTKRRQIAEEAAAKTAIKLIFPLVFFIFPSLLVVLLGPAAIKMFDMLFGHVIK